VRALSAPVARASVDAVAVDATASDGMLASLVAALRAGGRMMAPVAMRVPEGLLELVRDDEVWVAQLQAAAESVPIPLARGARKPAHE
jgi:hypothetical protein